ncbi:MAG TPA: FAD-dependent oxidoreductase [Solirubrobacterales bacterium]|nr:FAD-dependent oxidoreductase [Solirubrobacterales bacterium]
MSQPWGDAPPSERDRRSYADAEPQPFWLDRGEAPEAQPALSGRGDADLAIVGGGLSGLWAAILAKERDPARDVVLLESETAGHGASGRNGGFILSSLTHGISNGLSRLDPGDVETLERLGRENLAETAATLERLGIDCDLELTGDVLVALEPYEEDELATEAAVLSRFGHDVELLDRAAVRAELDSPTYRAGLWVKSSGGIVDPARLVWGLRRAGLELGVRIHERTRVSGIARRGGGVELRADGGTVAASRALLATSAYRSPVGAVRRRIVPVYDYVLVTEPLSAAQREAIGWPRRQGFGDGANQFH